MYNARAREDQLLTDRRHESRASVVVGGTIGMYGRYLLGLTSQAGRTEGVRVESRQAEGMRRARAEEFLRDRQHVRLIPSTLKWACW